MSAKGMGFLVSLLSGLGQRPGRHTVLLGVLGRSWNPAWE